MVNTLNVIRSIESNYTGNQLDITSNKLGNRLIVLYYKTARLETRELITQFMHQAGPVWLRKLVMRDLSEIASSENQFASLDDYLGLLAANDDALDTVPANLA